MKPETVNPIIPEGAVFVESALTTAGKSVTISFPENTGDTDVVYELQATGKTEYSDVEKSAKASVTQKAFGNNETYDIIVFGSAVQKPKEDPTPGDKGIEILIDVRGEVTQRNPEPGPTSDIDGD